MVNKCVFNCLLKDSMVEVILMLVSRLFQAADRATLKARSPKFVFGVRLGMFSNPCNPCCSQHRTFITNDGGSAQLSQVLRSHAVERLEDRHAELVLYPLGTSQPVEAIM